MNWFDSSFFFQEKEKRSKKESKGEEGQKRRGQAQTAPVERGRSLRQAFERRSEKKEEEKNTRPTRVS
ncbi:MAG: hypothetical protein J6J21_04110 [Clostridia bacterium]|nr:hypothetical protein [Clostridia bacterium]